MIRLVEVVTTVATELAAERLARTLVLERLAACANIVRCRSIYNWQGAVHDETEFMIHFKTPDGAATRLERRLREIHPYETPAILRMPVTVAEERYAAWVESSVDPEPREEA